MSEHPTKIDSGSVGRCKFPPLTKVVVEVMASAAFAAMEEQDPTAGSPTAWANVTEGVRESWRHIAKRSYAALATLAGARPEGIPEPPEDA